jgi:putative transposase
MPQSLAQLYTHLVFSTKHRTRYLKDDALRAKLHAYLAGACKNLKSPSLMIGGVEDHVHILCRLSKTVAASELVRELKRESSKWVKSQSTRLTMFQWQNGYGAFSISPSHVGDLTRYIAHQAGHHRTETFQDELRRLCGKYGIDIDERYVWD